MYGQNEDSFNAKAGFTVLKLVLCKAEISRALRTGLQ
jgi:hypothetical protein